MGAHNADPGTIARQIIRNPKLRARFFKDEADVLSQVLPSQRRFGLDQDTRELRSQVGAQIPMVMEEVPETASSAHAETVMQQFFQEAIRNPELSFKSILIMSWIAFVAGLSLIGVAIAIAVGAIGVPATANDGPPTMLLASVVGSTGIIGTLGSVLSLARRGISLANANHAQIRLVLAGFATELGHLRALSLQNYEDVERVNREIRSAADAAVEVISQHVKVPGESLSLAQDIEIPAERLQLETR